MTPPRAKMAAAAALLALLAAACPTVHGAPVDAAPSVACPRGCRCVSAGGETVANCTSPSAALALGSHVRSLRLTHYDDHLSVKEGAFRALPHLRELHLDRLGLVKVYPGAFRGLGDLEVLDLSHNALSAGDELSRALRDLPALKRLSLRGNNFGSAHGVAPVLVSRTVKYVDLGRCKLRDLPNTLLGGLSHVRHVVLDGNFIRRFDAAAFPKSAVSIDLSHNDIDHISKLELSKLENVDSIELAENPLHCNCELLSISLNYNMNKPVICASPKHLMGKDLLNIKKSQVCLGHKKVKREAGNELDDEDLSLEKTADGEDLEMEENEQQESELQNSQPTPDEKADAKENTEDEGTEEGTPEEEEAKDKLEEFEGKNDREEFENLSTNEKLENIHDEPSVPAEVEDEKKTSEEVEPHSVADRSNNNDDGNNNEDIESDNAAKSLDNDAENKENDRDDGAVDEENVENEPPDSLPASTYNQVVAENKATSIDDNEDNEDTVEEKKDDASLVSNNEDVPNEKTEDGDLNPIEEETVGFEAEEKQEADEKSVNDDVDDENVEAVYVKNVENEDTEKSAIGASLLGGDEKIDSADDEFVDDNQEGAGAELEPEGDGGNDDKSLFNAHSPNEEKQSYDETEKKSEKSEITQSDPLEENSEVERVDDNINVVHPDTASREEPEVGNVGGSSIEKDPTKDELDEGIGKDVDGSEDTDKNGPADPIVTGNNDEKSVEDNVDENEDPIDENIEDDIIPGNVVAAVERGEVGENGESANEGGVEENRENILEEKTLEEELKEDRAHATLSHADIEAEESKNTKTIESKDDAESDGGDVEPVVPPLSADDGDDEDAMSEGDTPLVEEDDQAEGADRNAENEKLPAAEESEESLLFNKFEEVDGVEKIDKPGDVLSAAVEDGEESDEQEGSGAVVPDIVPPAEEAVSKEDDWNENTATEKATENEAVPPLVNADSNEDVEESQEKVINSESESTANEGSIVVPAVGANSTEEESGSGAGSVIGAEADIVDQEEATKEEDEKEEGSGRAVVFGEVPTIKENDADKEDEDEGSGKDPFIPIPVPDSHDETSDEEEPELEEEAQSVPTTAAPVIVEEVVPKHHVPVNFAPPEEDTDSEEDDSADVEAEAAGKEDQSIEEKESTHERKGAGRALGPPLEPKTEDEETKTEEGNGHAQGGDEDVVVVADVSEDQKGNIEAGPGADGSEAVTKDDMWSLNAIGSYAVLGVIMVIVVVLLGYAVCRSRRQKSSTAREKDVESAGREMQDVNKPLINNHHPSAPEKQPLDETQQPLMTKEQEASLTVDPEKKPLMDADAAETKPKQNGAVPEVVVEKQNGPTANGTAPAINGKAAGSPASERAPSPPAPAAPAPTPSPTATPTVPSPTDGGGALPLVNGGSPAASPTAALPAPPAAAPVSPGAVRVVAKELPDSVAKRPVIIMNRGADPAQQV